MNRLEDSFPFIYLLYIYQRNLYKKYSHIYFSLIIINHKEIIIYYKNKVLIIFYCEFLIIIFIYMED